MRLDIFYPMPLIPLYKSYLWGGKRISRLRALKEKEIAESWEVVDRENEQSIVEKGPLQGKTLHELMGEDLLGKGRSFDRFPLLVKLIDANKDLSVQVHPDEKIAPKLHGESKNEMWYAMPGSKLSVLAGLKEGIDRKFFEQSVQDSSVAECLQKVTLEEGELLFIPAGTVHAILQGAFLVEVQENSDTTYRIYDWDRKDATGKKRELHLEKAFSAIDWKSKPKKKSPPLTTAFFTFQAHQIEKKKYFPSNFTTFHIYMLLSGEAEIEAGGISFCMERYRSYLVPAKADHTKIRASEPAEVLQITL